MTLDQLQKGATARITSISGDVALRQKLLNFNISLHADVEYLRSAPAGNPLEFLIGDNMVVIRKNIAQKIQVELQQLLRDI